MYTWSQLGINEITSLYLYGATTKPQDVTSEALIRVKGFSTSVQLDAVSFMANGPGRFANAISVPVVQQFMEGRIFSPNGTKQVFSLAAVSTLVGSKSGNTDIWQSNYQDATDDHAYRTYVYQSSSFTLAQGATFVIEADGSRHIQDFAILPFDDNFDFKSGTPLSQFGNPYLEPRIDPTGIGRIVKMEFDQTSKTQVPRVDYTSANYAADSVRYQQSFSPVTGTAKLAIEMPQVVADLWTPGTTQLVDGQGRLVLHGTAGPDNLSAAKFYNVTLYPSMRAALDQNGIALIGGDGADILSGLLRNDYLSGGAGDDTLAGGKGDDLLIGGAGDDVYIWNAGDGNDTIVDLDGGRLRIKGVDYIFGGGVMVKQGGSNVWKDPSGNVTITHNSPWRIELSDGSVIQLGEGFDPVKWHIDLEDVPLTQAIYNGDQRAPLAGNGNYDWAATSWAADGTLIGGVAELDFNDVINAAAAGASGSIVHGSGSNDALSGSSGKDDIYGDAGDDLIGGGGGSDTIHGGDGNDTILSATTLQAPQRSRPGEVYTLPAGSTARTTGPTWATYYNAAGEIVIGGGGPTAMDSADDVVDAGARLKTQITNSIANYSTPTRTKYRFYGGNRRKSGTTSPISVVRRPLTLIADARVKCSHAKSACARSWRLAGHKGLGRRMDSAWIIEERV
jgi:hypothetical protein